MSLRSRRGFTVVEMLVSIVVFSMLLFAIGNAVTHVVRLQSLDGGRVASNRTADELSARMYEEARCATAVFLPDTDVLGDSNSAAGGAHEVDMFRRLADGGASYVAYRFDSSSDDVRRFEYALAGGSVSIVHSDVVATGIGTFAAIRSAVGAAAAIVGAAAARSVSIRYGRQNVTGGNDIVEVHFATVGGAAPPAAFDVHLAAKAAPTSFSVLVRPVPATSPGSSASPAPSPSPPVGGATVIAIEIVSQTPNLVGGAGGGGLTPTQPQVVYGTATVSGPDALSWLEFSQAYPAVQSGTYAFKDLNGADMAVAIACQSSACPQFAPLPGGTDGSRLVFKVFN
ncbi:MAG: prepilin-type N-terminal cleavage/methylation domain-containing protein [Candidatus Eremiobacteraeota bacterium]|nr:prepilin-type N-terminal cleavage/methylation domain-containing protein [Candidatus Eremiobacteraeota bacterium]